MTHFLQHVAIWPALWLTAAAATFMIVERILFALRFRLADELTLRELLALWQRGGALDPATPQLGWMRSVLRDAEPDWRRLRRETEHLLAWTRRFETALPLAANLAPTLGLLGTFLAMAVTASSGEAQSPAEIIGLGIGTSIFGTAIAVPTLCGEAALRGRLHQLRLQVSSALEAIDDRLAQRHGPGTRRARSLGRPRAAPAPGVTPPRTGPPAAPLVDSLLVPDAAPELSHETQADNR